LVYFFPFCYFAPRIIWQPWSRFRLIYFPDFEERIFGAFGALQFMDSLWRIRNRVTGLGEFLPIGRLFPSGSFFNYRSMCPNFWVTISAVNLCNRFKQEMGWDTFWAIFFFKSSSGHLGSERPIETAIGNRLSKTDFSNYSTGRLIGFKCCDCRQLTHARAALCILRNG
jgi:hypothetical protein